MQVFVNTQAKRGQYTTLKACEADRNPDPAIFKPADRSVLDGLTCLYSIGGVRYWGHL